MGNGYFAYVDFKQSCIRLAKNIREVPENICISATIGVAFDLCRPRPPPPKDSNNLIAAYPPLPPTRPGVLNLDAMPFLVGSGLYASTLPRWYHATWWWRLWRWWLMIWQLVYLAYHKNIMYLLQKHFYHSLFTVLLQEQTGNKETSTIFTTMVTVFWDF